jgi:hypothetical protein
LPARGAAPRDGNEFATVETDVAQGSFVELTDALELRPRAGLPPEQGNDGGDQHAIFLEVGEGTAAVLVTVGLARCGAGSLQCNIAKVVSPSPEKGGRYPRQETSLNKENAHDPRTG